MPIRDKTNEIQRLIESFEAEAGNFHDLRFYAYYVTSDGQISIDREFTQPNHAIMLWQYYGAVGSEESIDQLISDINNSDLKWCLRGAALTRFGLIEGDETKLFVRMAMRAGSLFDIDEAAYIESQVISDIRFKANQSANAGKPMAAVNSNSLSVWLNYLLFHLSLTFPGREKAEQIDPDPFSLSLLALERLAEDMSLGKVDRSNKSIAELRFKVALSFPGEKRRYVSRVVDALRELLGQDAVFYDFDYQAQLAKPDLDTTLQDIYRNRSDLIVVFLCAEYSKKEWCGLEWRAIRDIIKSKQGDRIMFVRFDDVTMDGLFSIDGYIDGNSHKAKQVAGFVLERLAALEAVSELTIAS